MEDEIFQQLIQAPGELFNPEMRPLGCKFGNYSDNELGEFESGSFPPLGISDEHNTAALIASSMHSEYLDEWSAASSYDNSNLLSFIPQEQANTGSLEYKFDNHSDPVLGELESGSFPPLRDAIDVEQYSELQEIGGHGVSSDFRNNTGDCELDDYFLTTMDPAAPAQGDLEDVQEIDYFTFCTTIDEFERHITKNLQCIPVKTRRKPSSVSTNSASETSPQTKKNPHKTKRKANVRSSEIVPLDQKTAKTKRKVNWRPSSVDTVPPDQKMDTEIISDNKRDKKNGAGDETAPIQPPSTIHKNQLMFRKKRNFHFKTPSYLTTFPTNCDQFPVVFCCNDCAGIFFTLRAGQTHECIKKHPGRKVKC